MAEYEFPGKRDSRVFLPDHHETGLAVTTTMKPHFMQRLVLPDGDFGVRIPPAPSVREARSDSGFLIPALQMPLANP
jgi:hypothetical protein